MKKAYALGMLALLIAAACGVWLWRWKQDEPRRTAVHAVAEFTAALQAGDSGKLLQTVALPAAIQNRTPAEQSEFLTKALRDEISAEELAVLRRDGQFGLLANMFPVEAQVWSGQAGVKPEDCVAFKLDRNGQRAEVVLAYDSEVRTPNSSLKVVRCNNFKQLATPVSDENTRN